MFTGVSQDRTRKIPSGSQLIFIIIIFFLAFTENKQKRPYLLQKHNQELFENYKNYLKSKVKISEEIMG